MTSVLEKINKLLQNLKTGIDSFQHYPIPYYTDIKQHIENLDKIFSRNIILLLPTLPKASQHLQGLLQTLLLIEINDEHSKNFVQYLHDQIRLGINEIVDPDGKISIANITFNASEKIEKYQVHEILKKLQRKVRSSDDLPNVAPSTIISSQTMQGSFFFQPLGIKAGPLSKGPVARL